MKTYLQSTKRKELNPDYKGLYFSKDEKGNKILTTGFLKHSYWFDIWSAFDLLDWIRKNKVNFEAIKKAFEILEDKLFK